MKGWTLWISILAAGILIGFLTGSILDNTVWSISYDYVFPPGNFQELGIQIGFLASAFLGFVATFQKSVLLSPRQLIVRCLFIQIGILLITFLFAGGWALLVKWSWIPALSASVTPKARVAFCFGLGYGALIATLFATLYFCRFLLKLTQPEETIHG